MGIFIKAGECLIEFNRKGGGFPTKLSLLRRDGSQAVLMESDRPLMSMQLADGRTIYPSWTEELEPNRSIRENSECLEFEQLPWIDEQGCLIERFSLSLQYEFHPDGAVFINGFFLSDRLGAPAVKSMRLSYDLDLSSYSDVHYSYLDRPTSSDAYDIMFTPCARFLKRGLNKCFPERLVPLIDFNCRGSNESALLEFFLEGDGALSGKRSEVKSEVTWEHGNPRISWDFQTQEYSNDYRTYQWRNTWGFLITPCTLR